MSKMEVFAGGRAVHRPLPDEHDHEDSQRPLYNRIIQRCDKCQASINASHHKLVYSSEQT